MVYILRMTNGDCVVAQAGNERTARQIAMQLRMDEEAEVASIRPLERFAVQFSPKEDGSLEVSHWDGATFTDILTNEYPLLNEAYNRANAEPLVAARNPNVPALTQLAAGYSRNIEIIRDGLRRELARTSESVIAFKSKAVSNHR